MPETGTTLEVRRADDQTAIIAVHGELTGATEAALMDAYGHAAGPSSQPGLTKRRVMRSLSPISSYFHRSKVGSAGLPLGAV